MDTIFAAPSQNYPAATRTIGPSNKILATYRRARVQLTRESWPVANPIVTFSMEVSVNGTTWREFCRATAPGGNVPAPGGGNAPFSDFIVDLPAVGNPDRQLRSIVTNVLAFRTAATLQVE